jgi:hypothetical protein
MLNLIQHLKKLSTYETLKRVQGDRLGLFMRSSRVVSTTTLFPRDEDTVVKTR